jgi:hypothetical protein
MHSKFQTVALTVYVHVVKVFPSKSILNDLITVQLDLLQICLYSNT